VIPIWWRAPGGAIVVLTLGGVFVVSLLLRGAGVSDVSANRIVAVLATVAIVTVDVRYRRRRGLRLFDGRASTVYSIPTWIWGVLIGLILNAVLPR
jgi:hypothetical protein